MKRILKVFILFPFRCHLMSSLAWLRLDVNCEIFTNVIKMSRISVCHPYIAVAAVLVKRALWPGSLLFCAAFSLAGPELHSSRQSPDGSDCGFQLAVYPTGYRRRASPGFDDSSWTNLNLPHTWNNIDGQDGVKNYYRGVGWYRRHYTVDKNFAGRHFFLKFAGAFSVTDVYVNGSFVGEHQGGFAAFVFDVTPYLNVGADNVIAVKVNNAVNANIPPLSADFTFFGGLYRDVHLLVTDPVQISPLDYGSPGIYLQTTDVSSNSANLQVTAVLSNCHGNGANCDWSAV